ncbi:MAG: hypothetical protein ACTSXG_02675, partial [Alphaproteobacteria bacterium]
RIMWCKKNRNNDLRTKGNNNLNRRIINGGIYEAFSPGSLEINNLEPHNNSGASGGPHFCSQINTEHNQKRITGIGRLFGIHKGISGNDILSSRIFRGDTQ